MEVVLKTDPGLFGHDFPERFSSNPDPFWCWRDWISESNRIMEIPKRCKDRKCKKGQTFAVSMLYSVLIQFWHFCQILSWLTKMLIIRAQIELNSFTIWKFCFLQQTGTTPTSSTRLRSTIRKNEFENSGQLVGLLLLNWAEICKSLLVRTGEGLTSQSLITTYKIKTRLFSNWYWQ
jgi:hypothetical protein